MIEREARQQWLRARQARAKRKELLWSLLFVRDRIEQLNSAARDARLAFERLAIAYAGATK